jgi:serine/threonine protein kinase
VPVAIKVAKGASPRAVEALLREVEVAVSIKAHPNLVTVYGVCDGVDGELQLVLEYCEDGALLDSLRRLDKVCAARERSFAHSYGVLYFVDACVRRALLRGVVCRSRCRRRWMC